MMRYTFFVLCGLTLLLNPATVYAGGRRSQLLWESRALVASFVVLFLPATFAVLVVMLFTPRRLWAWVVIVSLVAVNPLINLATVGRDFWPAGLLWAFGQAVITAVAWILVGLSPKGRWPQALYHLGALATVAAIYLCRAGAFAWAAGTACAVCLMAIGLWVMRDNWPSDRQEACRRDSARGEAEPVIRDKPMH